jgi:hypothetical protein
MPTGPIFIDISMRSFYFDTSFQRELRTRDI